ncbi:MAG TPA: hypothetical protein VNA17_10945 [Pyrinomonadaceae bacterium]|nr:hypothetical protein [Pyrinomonadaceae bacterium]
MNAKVLACSMVVIVSFANAFSQTEVGAIPKLMPSTLAADIQARVKSAQNISVPKLAEFANKTLASKGFEFIVDPCDAKTTATKIEYPDKYEHTLYFHSYDFLDVAGKKIGILASEPSDAPCGCWLPLPLTFATSKHITLASNNGPIQVRTPELFLLEKVELVDRSLRKTSSTWIFPRGGPPDAISSDGRKLYMEIEDAPLYLEISPDGALRFVSRTAPGIIKRFIDLEKFPNDPDNAYLGYRRFSSGRKTFTYKFSHTCT